MVLEHSYEAVDHISLHMYFANRAKNTAEYLALNAKLDAYIGTIASTIEFVRAAKRSRKKVTISFDEWNVWYHSNAQDREILGGNKGWPHAPRLLEDIYNFEDVLQVGCILNTFIRRSDVVKIACIAQLVNVIAPIMTEPKGAAWRQTIYYPYYFASGLRTRRGPPARRQIARLRRRSRRQRALSRHIGRSRRGRRDVDVLRGQPPRRGDRWTSRSACTVSATRRLIDHQVMTSADLEAANTLKKPKAVTPAKGRGAKRQGRPPDRDPAALFLSDAAAEPGDAIGRESRSLRV